MQFTRFYLNFIKILPRIYPDGKVLCLGLSHTEGAEKLLLEHLMTGLKSGAVDLYTDRVRAEGREGEATKST